jgi:hypothetical protein
LDRVHEPVDRERRRSTVDHDHRPREGSPENGRNGVPVRGGNLTAVEEKWRGDGGEPHWLQERAAEGQTRPGDGGEQSAEEVLGGVGAADSEARH